ncbi:MAG: hypothetical protein KDE20_22475, partial [Caldilineaceae bacterium]|nr:hypothetical protein [Caldilineaceae bacterium]
MAKTFRTAFFAYPAVPADLRLSVELASEQASTRESKLNVTPWAAMDALGAHIADEVRKRIAGSSFLVAEITRKNFNVYYEIGYAIGKGIPLLPVVNRSFADASRSVRDDGFFDNILYETYENAEQLSATIASFVGTPLLQIYARDIEINQPLYVLDSYRKTDFRNAIISTVKGSKVFYRSFDPVETPRFSTTKIISEATASVGAIIPFLAEHIEDASRHNLRASFLAGIMHGLGRDVLLIQHGDNPVPADFREDIVSINSPNQVEDVVEQFSVEALKSIQSSARSHLSKSEDKSVLQRLSLGSSAAENEFRSLDRYFIETAEYVRAVKGDGKIVVGRKGSGKTAIFFMVRNHLRDNKNNIVADLKPESHELVKLREVLVSMASAGVLIHTFTGFWQIIILTELLLKVRESRSLQAKYSMEALNVITQIDSILERYKIPAKGDFTARLNSFVTRMIGEIEKFAQKEGEKISAEKLTNFVYGDEHRELRTELAKHCDDKGIVAVLFDNLDKGWPATGADPDDVTVIRSLIDALNKIQRELAHDDIDFRFSVFLRNDVYELL